MNFRIFVFPLIDRATPASPHANAKLILMYAAIRLRATAFICIARAKFLLSKWLRANPATFSAGAYACKRLIQFVYRYVGRGKNERKKRNSRSISRGGYPTKIFGRAEYTGDTAYNIQNIFCLRWGTNKLRALFIDVVDSESYRLSARRATFRESIKHCFATETAAENLHCLRINECNYLDALCIVNERQA